MYNWRLLLLAFVAVFQPIASFTERNLVDGRQQCCDHRLERDPTYSLNGNSRLKFPSEDHRLTSLRREIREVRRDERQHENAALSRLAINSLRDSNERDNRRSIELSSRSPQTESQREREFRAHVRNGMISKDRVRNNGDIIRNTRTNRIRIAPNRLDIVFRTSRVHQINRESNSRITGDAFENVNQPDQRRITNSQKELRPMQTRAELRRIRDSLVHIDRSTVHNQRRVNDESYERRALRSNLERNERNVWTLNRISRGAKDIGEERFDRTQSEENFRNGREHKMGFREEGVDERIYSRSTTILQRLDRNRERRSVSRAIRRENDFGDKIGDRAYEIDELRNTVRNGLAHRDGRRIVQERSLSAERRHETRDEIKNNVRLTYSAQRLSRSESRLTRNSREKQIDEITGIAASDRITEYAHDNREHSREIAGDRFEHRITDSYRLHARNNVNQQRSDENRETRETQSFRERVMRRITLEQRPNSENRRRLDDTRNHRREYDNQRNTERMETRSLDRKSSVSRTTISLRRIESGSAVNERQVRERASSDSNSMPTKVNREIARDLHIVRDDERRGGILSVRNTDRTREVSRDIISMRRMESRTAVNERQIPEHTTSQHNRLLSRINEREVNRNRRTVRHDELMETRKADQTRRVTRDTIVAKRIERNAINQRQIRERVPSESNRLTLRINDREITRDRQDIRDNERSEIRDAERSRIMSRDNISMRRIDSRTAINERQTRERSESESNRPSFRMKTREIARDLQDVSDNERLEIRGADRTRIISRDNIAMRRIESRTAINERQTRERTESESNRLSFRMNTREVPRDRRDVRDNERLEIRDADQTRVMSRDNISMRRIDSRTAINERQTRERAESELNRLSSRINQREVARDQQDVRDKERLEFRDGHRRRDMFRENMSMRRIDTRTAINERQARQRASSEPNKLSSRMTEREVARDRQNVRDNERKLTRNADRTRELSRDNISSSPSESRRIISNRQTEERASETSRLSFRLRDRETARDARDRHEIRDTERMETRNADRTREVSRMMASGTRSGVDSRSHVTLSQKDIETETKEYCWQSLIYTLQAIYLCSIFIPMIIAKNRNNKKIKAIVWWTPFQSGIKMD